MKGFFAQNQHLLIPVALCLALLALAAAWHPALFTATGLAGAILVVAPLALCTLALTPIVMVGRGSVELSVGPMMGFINVSLVAWLTANGFDHPVAIFGWAIGAGMALQALLAATIIWLRIAPIIVSLAAYLVLSGVNLMIMPRAGGLAPEWMMDWGAGTSLASPVTLVLIGALFLWLLFRCSAFHGHVRLTGADEKTAYTAGVRTDLARLGAHLVGGVFVGLAAVCYTALISSGDPTQGSTFTLQAVTALVLGGASLAGGRAGATGSLLGAINMFLIANLLTTFNFGMASGGATKLAFGLILVGSLLLNILTLRRRAI